MTNLLEKMLNENDVLLADGATGTNLFKRGLQSGDAPEMWNFDHPDRIRAHYRDFIDAGSDIVLTNSFGGTANRLKLHGLEDKVFETNKLAAELLQAEIKDAGRTILCAGSVGPTGDLFEAVGGSLTVESAIEAFREQMRGLKAGGADVAWIETMSSLEELEAALEAAKAEDMPAVSTMSFDTNGRTMMGVTPTALGHSVHHCVHPPHAYGGNCGTGAPDLLIGILSAQEEIKSGDVVVTKANCGIPEFKDGGIVYSGTEALMADYACLARDLGVRIIGGCCGTSPAHVSAMRKALDTRPRGEKPDADKIIALLGDVTGKTMELLEAGDKEAQSRPARRRRRAQH